MCNFFRCANRILDLSDFTPTKIYVKSCLPLIKKGLIKGMAQIAIVNAGLVGYVDDTYNTYVKEERSQHCGIPSVVPSDFRLPPSKNINNPNIRRGNRLCLQLSS